MENVRLYVVDSFTGNPFRGNPAGVVLLDEPADPAWMQSVAAELKHAETAFVEIPHEGPKPLRWFTPTVEVDLCGHATLATGHVLGGEQVFTTRGGVLRTRAENGRISMDFPTDRPETVERDLSAALPGIEVEDLVRGRYDLLAVVSDAARVRALKPDLDAIAELDTRCLIVSAPGDAPGIDFVSRVFGPAVGVPEDPVTGSAHCLLSPYWSARLGRLDLVGEQASPRGGTVETRLAGDHVTLSGHAVTMVEGELLV